MSSIKASFQNIATGILVACAVLVTGVVYFSLQFECDQNGAATSMYLVNWEQLVEGRSIAYGKPDAPITIIEFGDYECPFCVDLQEQLILLLDNYPGKVALYRYSLPAGVSDKGQQAAIASKCAERFGIQQTFQFTLYEKSHNLHNSDLAELAYQAGASDKTEFQECLLDDRVHSMVEFDKRTAKNLGIGSTPTLIINGKMIVGLRDYSTLNAVVQEFDKKNNLEEK